MSYNFNTDIDRNGKKNRPKCAKCRNHGLLVLRLGHKGCCQYEECECELCKQTKTRNDAMAKTMANERRRKKETGRNSVSSTTSPSSDHYPYSTSDRRTSFNLQLDGYNPSNGGNLGSYNVGRVSNTMSYTSTATKTACNPFTSPVESKVFGANGYPNFYHRPAPQGFPAMPYKTEPDQRAAFLNLPNGFGAPLTQPHLTMIGSTNK